MSLEEKFTNIENLYSIIYDRYNNLSRGYNQDLNYINETIKLTLSLQSDIELIFEDAKKLKDNSIEEYYDRINNTVNSIRFYIRGGEKYTGAISCLDLPKTDYSNAYERITLCRNRVFRFCEDIRLIYKLKIYPIEEKIVLKSKLSDFGFIDTINCLDEVDNNIANSHHKDAIDRSREGLEKLISNILIKLDKKPSNHFNTDMGTLSGMGFIDKENKKLIEATYSFLTEVGAHGRAGKYEYSDTYYAVKETYMRIDILINLLEKYLKTKKKTEQDH